jgi:hypothetical protein
MIGLPQRSRLIGAGSGNDDRDTGIGADRIILEMSLKSACAMKHEHCGGVGRNREGGKPIGSIAHERLGIGRIVLNKDLSFGARRYVQCCLANFGDRAVNR